MWKKPKELTFFLRYVDCRTSSVHWTVCTDICWTHLRATQRKIHRIWVWHFGSCSWSLDVICLCGFSTFALTGPLEEYMRPFLADDLGTELQSCYNAQQSDWKRICEYTATPSNYYVLKSHCCLGLKVWGDISLLIDVDTFAHPKRFEINCLCHSYFHWC